MDPISVCDTKLCAWREPFAWMWYWKTRLQKFCYVSRELMSRLFAFVFAWIFFVTIVLMEIRELIIYQLVISFISYHWWTVFRFDLLLLRKLVERANCQRVQNWNIYNLFHFSLRAYVADYRVFFEIVRPLWCVTSFALLFFVLTMADALFFLIKGPNC